MRRALAGDGRALETLWFRHSKRLHAIALRLLEHRQDAEDVVSCVCLKFLGRLSTYRLCSNFAGWIDQVVRNEVCTFIRCRTRRPEVLGHERLDEEEASLPDVTERTALANMLLADWMGALEGLSATKVATLMDVISGMPLKDMATKYGVSVGTIKSRIFSGKEQVQRRMRAREEDMPNMWTSCEGKEGESAVI